MPFCGGGDGWVEVLFGTRLNYSTPFRGSRLKPKLAQFGLLNPSQSQSNNSKESNVEGFVCVKGTAGLYYGKTGFGSFGTLVFVSSSGLANQQLYKLLCSNQCSTKVTISISKHGIGSLCSAFFRPLARLWHPRRHPRPRPHCRPHGSIHHANYGRPRR